MRKMIVSEVQFVLLVHLLLLSATLFLLLGSRCELLVLVAGGRVVDGVVEQVHHDVRERLHLVVRPAVVRDDLRRSAKKCAGRT